MASSYASIQQHSMGGFSGSDPQAPSYRVTSTRRQQVMSSQLQRLLEQKQAQQMRYQQQQQQQQHMSTGSSEAESDALGLVNVRLRPASPPPSKNFDYYMHQRAEPLISRKAKLRKAQQHDLNPEGPSLCGWPQPTQDIAMGGTQHMTLEAYVRGETKGPEQPQGAAHNPATSSKVAGVPGTVKSSKTKAARQRPNVKAKSRSGSVTTGRRPQRANSNTTSDRRATQKQRTATKPSEHDVAEE